MAFTYTEILPAPQVQQATPYDVRMRDGVTLSTDHYRSHEDTETGPTILIRLPYDKLGDYTFIPLIADYMAARGYHVIAQDVRGKFRSGGETLMFVNEADDGYDTIEWITQQPWSNGSVAMWGDSYYGFVQWAAVSSGHPALKAISPRVTGTTVAEFPTVKPGTSVRDVMMAFIYMYPLAHFAGPNMYTIDLDWTRPYAQALEAYQDEIHTRSASFDLWYPHPVHLRRFPHGSPFDSRAVPVLHTIGWWDNCAHWSWRDQEQLSANPAWYQNTYLLVEPIDHENYLFGSVNNPDGRSPQETLELLPKYLDPALEFFDVFVRGQGPVTSIPRVRWNLAGTEGYRLSDEWPPRGTERTSLYPTADGGLAPAPSSTVETRQWEHDPDNLVPSTVHDSFAYLQVMPDERALTERLDTVVFSTAPYADPQNLVGPVELTAVVSSSGPAMDVFARLYDVAPDGKHTRIARGNVHVEDATAGMQVTVSLGHLGYLLEARHRIVLLLSSSDFPEYIPQPGTGENPWLAVDVKSNTQTIVCGGESGTVLTLGTLAEVGPAYTQTGRNQM